MLVPAAFLAIYTISLCSFSSFFFFSLSIFLNPWRCLWRVSAPSVMWVVSVSAWLGSGPFHGPSHLARRASRPGLNSLETCDFFLFLFLDPGESLYALITPSEERVWGHCFRGARAIWSSCKSYNQLQTQESQKGNEGLIRLGRASFMLIYYLSKAALEIINLLLMKWKSEQRFHSVCFFS